MQVKHISEIKGYEEFTGYRVGDDGGVYSDWGMKKRRNKISKPFTNEDLGRKLKPGVHPKGYCYVDICNKGKRKSARVHRLVALAFIPNPENKPQVNHIDGNKQNNNVGNLEWVTNRENRIHALNNGLKDEISYGIAQYDLDDNLIDVFPTAKKALESLGIKENIGGNIGRVIRGKRKTAYGYKWKQYEGSTTSRKAYTQASGNREHPMG